MKLNVIQYTFPAVNKRLYKFIYVKTTFQGHDETYDKLCGPCHLHRRKVTTEKWDLTLAVQTIPTASRSWAEGMPPEKVP